MMGATPGRAPGERGRILFVAPNSYVLRNWIASGLADACVDTLGLEPSFVTHFDDPTFTGPSGRAFVNHHVPLARVRGKELPADYPRALYLLYYLRLRVAARELPYGGGQLLRLSRRRDAWHYAIAAAARVLRRGGAVRRRLRERAEATDFAVPRYRRLIEEIEPACVVTGTPAIFFLDQLMTLAARQAGVRVHCVVNSWDNLVSRGPMMQRPDSLMVWNACMREHALRVHGLDAGRVHVVGSLQFTQYARPVTDEERRAIARRVGVAHERPYLLYLGSAEVPQYEAEDVARLLEVLDASEFRGMPLVARLHPQVDAGALESLAHPALRIDRPPRFQGKGGNGLSFGEREMRAMAALLSGARVVFASAGTTALLEAAIFDRPMVQLRWLDALPRARPEQVARVRDYQRYVHIQDLDATGCRLMSDRPDTLLGELRDMLAREAEFSGRRHAAVERLVTTPVGSAPARVIAGLARELGIPMDAGRRGRISA
jgi:hypothetical protein